MENTAPKGSLTNTDSVSATPGIAGMDALEEASVLSELAGASIFVYEFASRRFSLFRGLYSSEKKAITASLSGASDAAAIIGVHPDDARKIEAMFALMEKEDSKVSDVVRVTADDGVFHTVKVTARAVFRGEKPQAAIGIVEDADDKKADSGAEKGAKIRDSLTSFLSHAVIQSAITHELKTRVEVRRDALVLIDFDNLSEINEKLGRVFGDEILIFAAEKIVEACKGKDCLFGRFSGDEFLLFFKDMRNDVELESILYRIIEMIQGLYVGEIGIPSLSASAGVVMTSGAAELRSLLEKAKKAIYIQKICKVDGFLFYTSEMEGEILGQYIDFPRAQEAGEEPHSGSETADMLLDILSNTKDLDSAINLSLLKIGRRYSIESERVIEFFETGGAVEAQKTYEWGKRTGGSSGCEAVKLSRHELNLLKRGGDRIVTGVAEKALFPLAALLPKESSIAAAKIYNEGELSGFLVFSRADPADKWGKNELSVLRTFAKILSSYIAKTRGFIRAEEMVKRISQTDQLTGLYNYNDFRVAAAKAVNADGGENDFAVCALDVRGFKYVNEFYGYKGGNMLLKAAADFFIENRYFELGCRMLSDIFLVLVKMPKGVSDNTLNREIHMNMEKFLENQLRHYPRCNLHIVCGTCRVSLPDVDVQKAMDNANTLRKLQKNEFATSCKIYTGETAAALDFRTQLTNSLPAALAHHEFIFHLQPKVSVRTGRIVGAEALVRWEKDGKMLPPGLFLPVFESNGLITMIDFYVYEIVCRHLLERLKAKKPVVPISLNVSGVHLQSKGFAKSLLSIVRQHSVPPELLEFELTETVLLENLEAATKVFSFLQKEGFKISIDDFGSGHSSMLLLKEFQFDVVKMDKGFLPRNEEISGKDKIILSSAIDMAAKLNIKVLCEGVEKKEHVDFLKTTACDLIQGFYFSKPLPVKEFDKLIEENHAFEV